MCCRSPDPARRQRGVALIVALLVAAICAALAVGLQRDFTLAYQRGSNRILSEQGWAYLRGAEALAATALVLDHDADVERNLARDDLTEIWAQEATPYALDEGGWLVGSLVDLQGRFNLNGLAAQPADGEGSARYSAEQQFFIRLLQSLEGVELSEYEAIAVTEAVADWLDEDDEPRLNGAESPAYSAREPAYRPGNRPMASVSELRMVANVTPVLFRALAPLVTVWPRESAPLNIHTAAPQLLRALNVDGNLQPLSAADAQQLLQLREESGFADRDDFLAQPVFAEAPLDKLARLLGESSSYFLLDARVEIADREQRLYSVLRRESRQVTVLARTRVNP
jgi:general secretion pathway protein K